MLNDECAIGFRKGWYVMNHSNEFKLKIGETAKVRPGVFRAQVAVVYAGKINDSCYSVAVTWSYGHNSMAYNLYFNKDQRELPIPKGRIKVHDVSADSIWFSHQAEA